MHYDVKSFKHEVMCDVDSLEVCDVLLGNDILRKHHVLYKSRPHSVIITLGYHLYNMLEVASTIAVSLITTKQYMKAISHIGRFVLFMVQLEGK